MTPPTHMMGLMVDPKKPARRPDALMLLDLIAGWCGKRSHRITACYVASGADEIWLYVVGAATPLDLDLNAELAEFAIALADRGFLVAASLLPADATPDRSEYVPGGGVVYQLQFAGD